MEPGRIVVKKKLSGFLLFGLGWSELYWRDGAGEDAMLLSNEEYFEAHRCPSCEAVLTDPQRTAETRPKPYVPENQF